MPQQSKSKQNGLQDRAAPEITPDEALDPSPTPPLGSSGGTLVTSFIRSVAAHKAVASLAHESNAPRHPTSLRGATVWHKEMQRTAELARHVTQAMHTEGLVLVCHPTNAEAPDFKESVPTGKRSYIEAFLERRCGQQCGLAECLLGIAQGEDPQDGVLQIAWVLLRQTWNTADTHS